MSESRLSASLCPDCGGYRGGEPCRCRDRSLGGHWEERVVGSGDDTWLALLWIKDAPADAGKGVKP